VVANISKEPHISISGLLGCDAMLPGRWLSIFQRYLLPPSSRSLMVGTTGSSGTSVTNYQITRCHIPESQSIGIFAQSKNCEARETALLDKSYVTSNNGGTVERGVFPTVHVEAINDSQLMLWESPDIAIRRVGGWCEKATGLTGCESRSTETSTVGTRYSAVQ
jgi:hypothetical protein